MAAALEQTGSWNLGTKGGTVFFCSVDMQRRQWVVACGCAAEGNGLGQHVTDPLTYRGRFLALGLELFLG